MPPVRAAMSSSEALRRSPKEGARTARKLRVPRILLTTIVASASPSKESQSTTRFLEICSVFSTIGSRSLMSENLWSVIRM